MAKLITKKPHAVCIPFPAQSHVNAMLKFAKLLHCKGFHITFVHTEFNYNRILKSRGPNSLDGSSDFRFETIPDGLPSPENDDDDAPRDVFQLLFSTDKTCHAPFLQLLKDLNAKALSDDNSPPITCILSDCCIPFTLEASEELGIPNAQIWTVNAVSAMCTMQYPKLYEQGYAPLKDESYFKNGYLDQTIDWIPGISSIRLRDLAIIWTTEPVDPFFQYMIDLVPKTLKGSALIINTFDSLEYDVLKEYSSMVDHFYPIGPMHSLLREIQDHEDNVSIDSIQSNLWKEDEGCTKWLDSKEKGSVVYVNFGSITVMTRDQLVEFAWGLANSMHNFLWIIRPDLVPEGAVLPPEFVEATKSRGMISTWCNQELVLNHPSVGVFLTHCGWNSILESLSAGVPLICWPFFADQPTNCLYCCSYWGVGVEIDNNVDREEVEKVIKETMEGEKGKEMKEKALEWKKKAEDAIRPCVGSSYLNLDKLIQEVLLQPLKSKSLA